MHLKSFGEFEINEGRSTIVPDTAFFGMDFIGTWTNVKFGIAKERGIAFKYPGHVEGMWWLQRKSIYVLLEDSTKLLLSVLNLEDSEIDKNVNKNRSGIHANSDASHISRELKDKIISGDNDKTYTLGPIALKIVTAYRKATGFTGSDLNFYRQSNRLRFTFEGQREDLKSQIQIFNEELHKEFKTFLTSQRFGL
jgi:hypothetical protein